MGIVVATLLADSEIFVVVVGSGFRERLLWDCDSEVSSVIISPLSLLQAMMARKRRIKPVEIIFRVINLDFLKGAKFQLISFS